MLTAIPVDQIRKTDRGRGHPRHRMPQRRNRNAIAHAQARDPILYPLKGQEAVAAFLDRLGGWPEK